MPSRSPRFWLEILILGFLLTFGMIVLRETFEQSWGGLVRVGFVALLFVTYGRYYDRTWNQKTGR